jgi:hypothetical protein
MDTNGQPDQPEALSVNASESILIKDSPQTEMSPIGQTGKSFPITFKNNKEATLTFSSLPVNRSDLELLKKYIDLMSDNWIADQSSEN